MPLKHPRKETTIYVRMPDVLITLLDQFAAEAAESRSAAMRIALRAGLQALGVRAKD